MPRKSGLLLMQELQASSSSTRVIAMTEDNFDPFGAPARPNPRTTEDYLREREAAKGEG